MGLLTIGVFARTVRLTPKALRLYDDLGLLPPAAVDPDTGYRLYHPDQVPRARLIGRLRAIGMPLAEIRAVCGLPPAAAAEAVDTYWRRVVDDTAARGRLATVLVDHLSGRDTAVREPGIGFRYATGCETGPVRDSNEDATYASDRLLAVADGMRGPGGASAAATAVAALAALDPVVAPAVDLLTMLAAAVTDADRAVRRYATADHQPVTTLTAVRCAGTQVALVHIGDTRVYLLRDGGLHQLTRDHTYVQSLVDQGRLDPAEVSTHPQRSLLVRALGAGERVEVDLSVRAAQPGDRYLLCSDGLSTVLDRADLHAVLTAAPDPDRAVTDLMARAYAAGALDNIACVVADVVTD
ncbi:MerR family transcriptional regulator [Micromonospora cathayae]|uniref:MerR family transcriptional regulator n=1 Tax=Micromonospora cathayae TaxID=3028804 RepID=A0ABY7ZKS8_9ACTN|nr:MerR family transcriptional regulator [Micromonospora sp. HUAS 3]WDZ83118.1 MerR family transcriptional regulator [Micromonospora sp. HUAS 3]